MESALTIKGQATIPKAIREHLRLEPGDRIKFFKHPDGTVVILPKLPTARLKGIVSGRRRRPASLAEMDEAVVTGATRSRTARQ
jgi:AbrB family looped-hinge helix DNA binding protein